MMSEGKYWHIDNDGILFIGKEFKRGKGFLPWFNDRESITGLVLEEGMEINNSAFYECTELERVILPESLTAIWEKAFMYCRSLREITIPAQVWHITDDVFDDCPSLKRVIVRSNVLENMYWVPEGCEIIKES